MRRNVRCLALNIVTTFGVTSVAGIVSIVAGYAPTATLTANGRMTIASANVLSLRQIGAFPESDALTPATVNGLVSVQQPQRIHVTEGPISRRL